MKMVNGKFVLSNTDRNRIEAHTRALARKARYDGSIEAWFDSSDGTIRYDEFIGNSYMAADSDDIEFICSESCHAEWWYNQK